MAGYEMTRGNVIWCLLVILIVYVDGGGNLDKQTTSRQSSARADGSRGSRRPPRTKQEEVVAYVRQNSSDWRNWPWEKLDAIVAIDFHDNDLLHHAREHDVKYGLLVTRLDFPLFGETMDYDQWVQGVAYVMSKQQRQVIHFDLESIFRDTGVQELHARLGFIKDFVGSIRVEIPGVEVAVLHAWKSDFTHQHQCSFVNSLLSVVDYLVLVTKNYIYTSPADSTPPGIPPPPCVAKPQTSYGSLVTGLQGLVDCGVRPDRMVPLFGWQASLYLCNSLHTQTGECILDDCYDHGKTMDLASIMSLRQTTDSTRIWNHTYSAPFFSFYNTSTGGWAQVWYEDVQSLSIKYDLIQLYHLRGLAIWRPGSLTTEVDKPHMKALQREMWHLIGPPEQHFLANADPASDWKGLSVEIGPAIGLILAGFLLGGVTVGSLLHYKYRQRYVLHASLDEDTQVITGDIH